MRLLDLPSWLDTWGLAFDLLDGWEGRGVEFPSSPLVVVGHHTATSARARGDLPTWRILRDGRPDLPGPLSQTGLGRSGRVLVIASGKANHAGAGAWFGLPGGRDYDVRVSSRTVGIEAEHPGDSSPWPRVQLDAYDRLIACLLWGLGQQAEAYCGHREWALPSGRKPDPRGIYLPGQRRRVAALLTTGPSPILPPAPKGPPTMMLVLEPNANAVWLCDRRGRHRVEPAERDGRREAGVPYLDERISAERRQAILDVCRVDG
jgi:hypothetical protein